MGGIDTRRRHVYFMPVVFYDEEDPEVAEGEASMHVIFLACFELAVIAWAYLCLTSETGVGIGEW
jgi:hypothetical protein